MPIRYANKKSLWPKLAIAAWIVLGTLAYGHSYANNPYKLYYETRTLADMKAGVAAIAGPVYWLSVAGVALFEESK